MSITSANAIVTLAIGTVFPIPVQLQGFAADNVFSTQPLKSAETLMGVDGKLSGGFVFVPVEQEYELQADSPSNLIFDTWYSIQQSSQEVFSATGLTVLTGVSTSWVMTNGFLTMYSPIPDAKKLLQPRKFGITWNSISPAPV